LRILVADDHETVRKGVSAILTSHQDLEVCGEAANGREAVEKANELQPDLIILDITMPKLNGFEAALEIRKTMPAVPILFLSMHDGRQMLQASKTAGVQGYVTKTQASETLLHAVDALLRGDVFFPTEESFRRDLAGSSASQSAI
jgi:DNA-binding NarL/FixJ family response regulator